MKTQITILCIAAIVIFGLGSCNNSSKSKEHSKHDHEELHDHDHGAGSCSANDGHSHDAEEELHSMDDGHDHYENDGHDHDKDSGGHEGEIVFTKKQAEAAGLQIEDILKGSFSNVLKTGGQVQVAQGDEQTIVATANGIVSFSNNSLTDGSAVKSGETLVTISAKELQEGDPLLKAKLEYEAAEKEYKRAEKLVTDKIISSKEFTEIQLRYETAKATYQGQSGKVSSKGVRITSPINGFIKSRLVNQGSYVTIGEPIVVVTQNKKLQLRAEVSEKNYNQLKHVVSANFRTSYNDKTYKLKELNGKLISYGRTSGDNSYYIPVIFEFDNVGDVIPGSYAEVYLLTIPKEQVITLPLSALTEEQGLYYVYLQEEPEIYKKQEVIIGENNGERVEIMHGLKEGDKVVTKGAYQVKIASASGEIPHGHAH